MGFRRQLSEAAQELQEKLNRNEKMNQEDLNLLFLTSLIEEEAPSGNE